jgi:hypothetical protein
VTLHRYNVVFARGGDGPPPRFISLIEHACHARGLSFAHCRAADHAEWLREGLLHGDIDVDLLIDYMGRSFRCDEELGRLVRERGGLPVEDPDRVRAFGCKAAMHLALARAGVPLPRTLIWRAGLPARDLTTHERLLLGHRFVVKPASGSGGRGVSMNVEGSRAALAEAMDDPEDDYLLQEQARPLQLDGRPAWFRVYNCFGRVFACFWHPETHATALVSPEELAAYGLWELEWLSRRIAAVCGYRWFSSELALTEREGRRLLLPIDYNNNKPFMVAHSEFGERGMPDAVVEAVALILVEQAARRAAESVHALAV